jgi:subtilisin family serine protease
VQDVLAWAGHTAGIRSFEPDFVIQASAVSNDPAAASQWALNKIGATTAWNTTTGSRSVVVATIDSGIDLTHPDLAANVWTNPREIAGNGIDDDRDGYVDDVHGWNFVDGTGNVQDGFYHGTHVAGIIGAVGNNALGTAGLNWQVSIMPLKFIDNSGVGYTGAAIYAINYATMMRRDHGVNIVAINASYGGGTNYSTAMQEAIAAAGQAGITFVAAAGNGGANNDVTARYPSSYDLPNVIAVAGTDSADNVAGFSNYGATSVDLGAPGAGIYSTLPNNNYGSVSGTSMAAPQVTGAVALLAAARPGITVAQVRAAILGSVDVVPSLAGKVATGGRLNIAKAMASLGSLSTVTQPPAVAFTPIGVRLGTVEVGTAQLGYALRVSGGTPIQVTWSGGYASASNPGGGWTAIAARMYGSGYELLWRNTSGAYGSWILNASGGLVSFRNITAADVLQLETQYGVDINSDTKIGLTFTAIGVRLDTVEIGTTQLGYALRVDGGAPIPVIWGSGQASASNPGAGWAAIAARTYGSGYELLWRNTSGAYGSWILNASGGLVSFRNITAADVLQLETQYGVDINSDGRIGASVSQ